ncbi:hypothetical protein KY345_03185 [Candidatus Woesearchaeota archaeon]|nr:hypothetical protein [Candidatus Woesearchaeota archaeon]
MLLFHLSGENLELAREEVLALAGIDSYEQIRNVLLVDCSYSKLFERLGFTHGIFNVLFVSRSMDLMQDIMHFNFNRYYKKDFKVKIINFTEKEIGFDDRRLGGIVYKKLQKPKVNLTDPKTQFFFIFFDNKVFCCKLIKKITKSFLERKPHLKPELHPTSLSPKLAKALINLSGIRKGLLLDPFCGSGGILVEAGLMGLRVVGFDIDKVMLKRARINLEHYGVGGILKLQDAVEIKKNYDYVVSELPFGKNSRINNRLEKLYLDFLENLGKILVKRAVLVFPFDVKKLIRKSKLKIINEFDYYIHKSMTKKIYVLER